MRSPLLHFLLLGALLFGFQAWRSQRQDAEFEAKEAYRIEIDAELLDELRGNFARTMARPPTPAELDRMIATEVDEEILYREALARGLLERDGGVQTRLIQKMLFLEGEADLEDAGELLERALELGLDRDDIVVRRILVQKMRLFGSALPEDERPNEAEIAAAYERDRETYRLPDRISFVHVFSSADRVPRAPAEEAVRLRERLAREAVEPEDAIALGDPFPLGHRLDHRSQRDLSRTFGERFGAAAFSLDPQRWAGPIESAYGRHILWIDEFEQGETPPLEAVADRIRNGLEQQRREARIEALLSELRTRYEVEVDRSAAEFEAPALVSPLASPPSSFLDSPVTLEPTNASTHEGRKDAG
jgi:hypothetical protein